ncbi:hypothetical protein MLD52_13090 [Puniceicoccaceae bacterium K14]|nr:hypothetical protein [Puniceicoccaceae bacterium K14]
MPQTTLQFIYRDALGCVTLRTISDVIPFGEVYLQCYDADKDQVRTFRKDRILEIIEDSSIADSRLQWHVANSPPPKKRRRESHTGIPHKWNSEHLSEVCFTGFKKDDKSRLTKSAEDSGFYVPKKPTKKLKFLGRVDKMCKFSSN